MKPLPTIIAALLLAGLGITVVWQKSQLTRVGYEIGAAESEQLALEEQNRLYRAELSRVTGYEEVRRRVKDFGLPLQPPPDGRRGKK